MFDVVAVSIPSPAAIVNVSPNAILSDVEPSEKLKKAFVIAEFGMFVIVEFEPLMFATNSAAAIVMLPVASAVAVVVPNANLSALSSHMKIALLPVLPLSMIIPESLAFDPAPEFNSSNESDIVVLVVATVVVVPFTVKLPVITAFLVTVKSLPIVTSSGCEIVTVPELSATLISFEVPLKVIVPPREVAVEFEPSETVIDEFAYFAFAIDPAK